MASDDLVPHFRGADVVIHLAWLIQPGRDEGTLRATNVEGSRRTSRPCWRPKSRRWSTPRRSAPIRPGPKDRAVDESWPTDGIETSFYSRHKAEVERILDSVERREPRLRTVRLRPGLIFKREAASGIRRLFAGPFLPNPLLRPGRLPIVPAIPDLVFQAVHSLDVGEAYRLAATSEARGAFNIAADPVLDPEGSPRPSGRGPSPCRPGCVRTPPQPRSGCGCSPPSPAGSTWH